MELFSTDFLAALAAIIVIDLVLAGDNAIVIALAARNVPAHLRNRAIAWGTLGAIVVRTAMTMAVVWLLRIPGLLLAGGLALVWIAFRLLTKDDDDGAVDAADSFWGAMKTIVVADAIMGLDNVLAVAGAAHGSFLLVALGLVISIPIVISGSRVILHFVERYPAIIYVGAGVLAWTAAKMIVAEPLTRDVYTAQPWLVWMLQAAVIGGVLWAGFTRNRRELRERVEAHLVPLLPMPAPPPKPHPPGTLAVAGSTRGGATMLKMLIPVDGNANSLLAVRHAVNRRLDNPDVEIHLLHVRTPLSHHVARFLRRGDRMAYHRGEAEKALAPGRKLLESFSIPCTTHVETGDKAEAIHAVARRLSVDQIVMGTARKNSLTRLIEDSVTHRVIERAQVPVQVIAGKEVSRLERWGLPAGIGAALALLLLIED